MTPEQTLIARMSSGEPFTHGDLCRLFSHGEAYDMADRLVDHLVHKWRRHGWISYSFSKTPIWHLTFEGQAAVSAGRV